MFGIWEWGWEYDSQASSDVIVIEPDFKNKSNEAVM